MMAELLYNQFRGDKFLLLRVQVEPTLQEQVEAILGNKGLLFATTAKGKAICPNSALNLRGNEMILDPFLEIQESRRSSIRLSLLTLLLSKLMIWDAYDSIVMTSTLRAKVFSHGEFISLWLDALVESVEIDRLKQTLSDHLKEKESLMQTITLHKNDFKKEESRNIDREIALEKKIKELDNIVFKRDQSAQTVHMLTKPQYFYDHTTRQALGPTLSSRPTKVEVPKELPKVSMVNMSLKKPKYHLAGFDVIVK
ncbi:hypothetical protein Tco_1539284 [Tanacetum coccineum]